jgi:hypothetical protein
VQTETAEPIRAKFRRLSPLPICARKMALRPRPAPRKFPRTDRLEPTPCTVPATDTCALICRPSWCSRYRWFAAPAVLPIDNELEIRPMERRLSELPNFA